MKSQLNWHYQAEASLAHSDRRSSFRAKLRNTWQTVLAYFAASNEPHVWKSQDISGLPQWKAYDPMTGQSVEYNSETDMRIWLEERHHQYRHFTR